MSKLADLNKLIEQATTRSDAGPSVPGGSVSSKDYVPDTDDAAQAFTDNVDMLMDFLTDKFSTDFELEDFQYDTDQKTVRIKVHPEVPKVDDQLRSEIADIFNLSSYGQADIKSDTVMLTIKA